MPRIGDTHGDPDADALLGALDRLTYVHDEVTRTVVTLAGAPMTSVDELAEVLARSEGAFREWRALRHAVVTAYRQAVGQWDVTS
jgi:hypothetical protein